MLLHHDNLEEEHCHHLPHLIVDLCPLLLQEEGYHHPLRWLEPLLLPYQTYLHHQLHLLLHHREDIPHLLQPLKEESLHHLFLSLAVWVVAVVFC